MRIGKVRKVKTLQVETAAKAKKPSKYYVTVDGGVYEIPAKRYVAWLTECLKQKACADPSKYGKLVTTKLMSPGNWTMQEYAEAYSDAIQ